MDKIKLICVFIIGSLLVAFKSVAVERPVEVELARQASFQPNFQLHGTVVGKGNVNLTAAVGGQLVFVAEPGATVTKGEIVARIDLLPLQLEKAEQELLIQRAQIRLQFQEKELERLNELAKTQATAQSRVDALNTEHALVNSDIELAKVKLKQLDDRIEKATVKAPFSGVVAERFMAVGSDVNRADPLIQFIDIENLEVRVSVPVSYFQSLSLGDDISFKSEFHPHFSRAKIVALIPHLDQQSQRFELRASIDNQSEQSGLRWASGQLVEVRLPTRSAERSILVARDALILRREGSFVVKIDQDNKAIKIPVNVLAGQGEWLAVEPLSEQIIQAGDRLAVRGAERLETGQLVIIN